MFALSRCIVGQAQHHHIDLGHHVTPGQGVLAEMGGQAGHRDVTTSSAGPPLGGDEYAETGGVDEGDSSEVDLHGSAGIGLDGDLEPVPELRRACDVDLPRCRDALHHVTVNVPSRSRDTGKMGS